MNELPPYRIEMWQGGIVLEKLYDVRFEDKCVGQVRVQKEGLYYRLNCLVKAPTSSKYHLMGIWENQQRDFGLCIPDGDNIGMITRIPIKNFAGDAVAFELKDCNTKIVSNFIPLSTQEPFAALDRLEYAYLECRDGILGICFRD